MKKFPIRFQYNAPVIVSFALLSALALGINILTGGKANKLLFCVYRCSLRDALCYPRFFLHVLGHSGYSHYISYSLSSRPLSPDWRSSSSSPAAPCSGPAGWCSCSSCSPPWPARTTGPSPSR